MTADERRKRQLAAEREPTETRHVVKVKIADFHIVLSAAFARSQHATWRILLLGPRIVPVGDS